MKIINGKAYKKVEPHLHLSPVSVCARLEAKAAVEKFAKCGFEALVLTNHYSRAYIDVHGASEGEWRKLYLENYRTLQDAAAEYGIEVFLGAEVTLQAIYIPCYRERWTEQFIKENFADYLVYGITKEFLKETPLLCDMTMPEFRKICNDYGAFIVQAHPFRAEQEHALRDVRFLDGVEINTNEGFPSGPHEQDILRIARENGLAVTCGGDIHAAWDHLGSATYIPEEIHDSKAFADYLRRVKIPYYSLDEPDPFSPSRKTI